MIGIILWLSISLWITITDTIRREITNIQIIVVIIIGIICAFLYDIKFNIWISIIILSFCILLWYMKLIGAGDAKLIPIMSFFTPDELIYEFLFLMTILGALIAILTILSTKVFKTEKTVPYGVAIMISFILIYFSNLYS